MRTFEGSREGFGWRLAYTEIQHGFLGISGYHVYKIFNFLSILRHGLEGSGQRLKGLMEIPLKCLKQQPFNIRTTINKMT